MKILAIESSAGPASCAITQDGDILAEAGVNTRLTHSQTLMPMVQDMLRNSQTALTDIDVLAVAAGPGLLHGGAHRVAAVKGLAFARGIPCAAVSTLAAWRKTCGASHLMGMICSVMDAPLPAGVHPPASIGRLWIG